MTNDVGLARALALFAIDRIDPATREWASATKAMPDAERRLAVKRAIAAGWFDRAVFGMGAAPDDVRHYSLRFPLHHDADIRAQAKVNGLDPAWVAGQTRAESSFMPRARSGADARGLMQVLPGTGAQIAKRIACRGRAAKACTTRQPTSAWARPTCARCSIATAVFRHGHRGYNAGPAPVDRWRGARSSLDPDFFIETIPYKETRDYVARVLAFSVVYDWRLDGNAAPLGERMLGRLWSPSRRDANPSPVPILQRPANDPMNIAVIGASGFVGRLLVKRLAARAIAFACSAATWARIRTACCRLAWSCTRLILRPQALRRAFDGADAVVNLVGILNERGDNGRGFHRAHVELARLLVTACQLADCLASCR